MQRFHRVYFLLTILILAIEILIARYTHDAIIRPYGGDYLCVIFLYTLIQAFWRQPVRPLALRIFVFACFVEVTQYFKLAEWLGIPKDSVLHILMGYEFTWIDIGCYAMGIATVLIAEKIMNNYETIHTS